MIRIVVGTGGEDAFQASFPGEPFPKVSFATIGEGLDYLMPKAQGEAFGEGGAFLEAPEAVLYLLPGVYQERLSIIRSNLTIRGAGKERTRIEGNLGGYEILEDGCKRGTFRTQTVFVHAANVRVRDLTIANTAGQGADVGQAIALYADGDRLAFTDVCLLGHQDTLFCGPLPEKEVEPGGFRGPLEHAPRINGRQWYKRCYIEGTVDFIFGSATAFFEECTIRSLDPEKGRVAGEGQRSEEPIAKGYITAPSTPQGQAYGFVFSGCHLEAEEGLEGSIYLGRPWRDYGAAVYLECEMGAHIREEGWHDWGKPHARQASFFAEYDSYGEGSLGKRAPFAKKLTSQEAERFSREKVLGDWAY